MNESQAPGIVNVSPPDTPLVALARALEATPRTIFGFAVGQLIAILTDPVSLSLAIASVCLALIVGGAPLGVAVFFFAYAIVRTINNIAAAIGASGRSVAERLERHG